MYTLESIPCNLKHPEIQNKLYHTRRELTEQKDRMPGFGYSVTHQWTVALAIKGKATNKQPEWNPHSAVSDANKLQPLNASVSSL